MPRPATGQVVERRSKDRRIYRSLRFHAEGKRHTLPLGKAGVWRRLWR